MLNMQSVIHTLIAFVMVFCSVSSEQFSSSNKPYKFIQTTVTSSRISHELLTVEQPSSPRKTAKTTKQTKINIGKELGNKEPGYDYMRDICNKEICIEDEYKCCRLLKDNDFQANFTKPKSKSCNIMISITGLDYIYSVSQCASNWVDNVHKIKDKCELGEHNIIYKVPVYSTRSSKTYKNMYCARCNYEFSNSLQFFQTTVLTPMKIYDKKVQPSIDSIIEECAHKDNCLIYHQPPSHFKIETCNPQIDYCWDDLNSIKFIEECKMNEIDLINGAKKINSDVAVCQSCLRWNPSDPFEIKVYSMDLLFRVSQLKDNIVLQYESTLENSVTINSSCEINETSALNVSEYKQTFDNYFCDSNNMLMRNKLSLTKKFKIYLTFIGQLLSIICLILLLIAFFTFKDITNTPAKMVIALSISLLLAQSFFLLSGQLERKLKRAHLSERVNLCYIFGIFVHYFYLAYFFWSNMISVDLFIRLGLTLKRVNSETNNSNKFYVIYSIVAWCTPLILIALLVTSQFYRKDHVVYGVNECYISNKWDMVIFFIAPVSFILLVNTVLFIITSISIRHISVASTIKKKNDWKRFILFAKLFVVMGVSWILGVLCSFIDEPILWCIYIIINSIQGLYLFIAYILNSETLQKLKNLNVFQRIINAIQSKTETSFLNT